MVFKSFKTPWFCSLYQTKEMIYVFNSFLHAKHHERKNLSHFSISFILLIQSQLPSCFSLLFIEHVLKKLIKSSGRKNPIDVSLTSWSWGTMNEDIYIHTHVHTYSRQHQLVEYSCPCRFGWKHIYLPKYNVAGW